MLLLQLHLSAAVISDTKLLQQLEVKESEKEKGRNLQKKKVGKCTEKVHISESSNSEEESEYQDNEDDDDDFIFTNIQ